MPANQKIAPLFYLSAPPQNKEIWGVFASYLNRFLESNRLSLFCAGDIFEKWLRFFPQDSFWMREKIKEGRLEFLGGTSEDILPPFFQQKFFDIQLKNYQDLLQAKLAYQPSGFFNPSMVWEIGSLPQLSKANYSYTLVEDSAIALALGRLSRISGWYSIENNGCLLRVLPIDSALTVAFEKGKDFWNKELTLLPNQGKIWVVLLQIPVDSIESLEKFWNYVLEIFNESVQTWTIAHAIEQQHSEGYVNLLSAVGKKLGLPDSSLSCRELLLRRPEINFLHKSLLAILRRAEVNLDKSHYEEILYELFPIMASKFYADLGNEEGIRTPSLRFFAHSQIIKAAVKIDSILKQNSIRAEITDYLLAGEQQVLLENSSMSFLIEPNFGAVLRSLNHKKTFFNFLNSFRDDGYVSLGFAEHLLPPVFSEPKTLDSMLQDRSSALLAPYDFQLERKPSEVILKMTAEQVLPLEEKSFIFHLDKNIKMDSHQSEFEISYKLTNVILQPYSGYFGSELEIGVNTSTFSDVSIEIDGIRPSLSDNDSKIFPNITELQYKDSKSKAMIQFKFSEKMSCLLSPIYGSEKIASPSILQGFRLFFFKPLKLAGMESTEHSVQVFLTKSFV